MNYLNRANLELATMMDNVFIFLGALIPSILTYLIALKQNRRELLKQSSEFELKKEELELQKRTLQAKNEELQHQKAESDIKMTFFNQIIDLTSINIISSAVDRIFEKTKADRFLIEIAVNGHTDFNVISVVFEQHKDKMFRINAIARYHNIKIDLYWKQLLKDTEKHDVVELDTSTMPDSVLKDFYTDEKVMHSLVRKLVRKPIDKLNDFLVYSSISTHMDQPFSRVEKSFIKTQYEGTIIPKIENVLSNKG